MSRPQPTNPPPPRRKIGELILSTVLAAVFLVWVFYDIDWLAVSREIVLIHWGWAALAILCDVFGYYLQGWRWSLLLRPMGRISSLTTTRAIYAGLFVNQVLPLRLGEGLRLYLISRWMPLPFTRVLASGLAERFLDAVWLASVMGMVVWLVPLPPRLLGTEGILAASVLLLAILLLAVVTRGRKKMSSEIEPIPTGFWPRLKGVFSGTAAGLRELGRSSTFFWSFLASGLMLFFQILSVWLIIVAYDLPLGFWQGSAVVVILHLGTLVPAAPAGVGAFQFFIVLGLTLFGVDKTTAAGFSIVSFILLIAPLWLLGGWAFAASGLSLHKVRSELSRFSER